MFWSKPLGDGTTDSSQAFEIQSRWNFYWPPANRSNNGSNITVISTPHRWRLNRNPLVPFHTSDHITWSHIGDKQSHGCRPWGKVPGNDGLPPELIKLGKDKPLTPFTNSFCDAWKKKVYPRKWGMWRLTPSRDLSDCNNYRWDIAANHCGKTVCCSCSHQTWENDFRNSTQNHNVDCMLVIQQSMWYVQLVSYRKSTESKGNHCS